MGSSKKQGLLIEEGTENLISQANSENFTGEEIVTVPPGSYTLSNQGAAGSVNVALDGLFFVLPFFPVAGKQTRDIAPGEHLSVVANVQKDISIKEVV